MFVCLWLLCSTASCFVSMFGIYLFLFFSVSISFLPVLFLCFLCVWLPLITLICVVFPICFFIPCLSLTDGPVLPFVFVQSSGCWSTYFAVWCSAFFPFRSSLSLAFIRSKLNLVPVMCKAPPPFFFFVRNKVHVHDSPKLFMPEGRTW